MELKKLKPPAGATSKKRRIGRGDGSGTGSTAGRGHKGQKARSGNHRKVGFEGGQMPLQRRMPKRGFANYTRVEYAVVNVGDLERFEAGSTVDAAALKTAGLIGRLSVPVKVLGGGTVAKKLQVQAQGFSQSAKDKIEQAGGQAQVVELPRRPVKGRQEG